MATVKGVNRTIADATDWDHTLKPGKFGGHVSCFVDTYEAAALPSGDTIEMGPDLPIGAKVLGGILYYDALGASVTLAVGDAETAGRYLAATAASTAGATVLNLADGAEFEVTEEPTATTPHSQVRITTGGAAATGTIKLVLFYTFE